MLRNFGFENGTSGVELTPTDTPAPGDNAFTARFRSTGSSIQYDSSTASAGTQSGKFSVAAGTDCEAMWESLGTITQAWIRFRIRLNAAPPATCRPFLLRSGGDATSQGFIAISTGRIISLQDQTFTAKATGTTALTLNQWYRVEAMFNFGAPAGELRIWNSPASTGTPDQDVVATTPTFTSGNIDAVQMGCSFSAAQTYSLNLDDLGISDVTWMGPGGITQSAVGLPIADITVANWTPSTGTSVFPLLSDSSDTTFVTSQANASGQVLEEKLSALSALPATVTARLSRSSDSTSGSAVVSLVQGTTVIASWTVSSLTTTLTDYTNTLTTAQQSAISDRTDLRVRVAMTVA